MLDSLNDTGKTLRRWLGQSQEGVRGYLGVRVRHETNPEHFVGRFVLPCEGVLHWVSVPRPRGPLGHFPRQRD